VAVQVEAEQISAAGGVGGGECFFVHLLSLVIMSAAQASVMRELKMKRFKAYAAKLRATIRQIKQDGGSGVGLSREEVAQHVEGGGKKKDKVCLFTVFAGCTALLPSHQSARLISRPLPSLTLA
jgi:hypothetical protein